MSRLKMEEILTATDTEVLRDFLGSINRRGLVIMSTGLRFESDYGGSLCADAYLIQLYDRPPSSFWIRVKAFKDWYPDRAARRRVMYVLNTQLREAEDGPDESPLESTMTGIDDKERFFSCHADLVEKWWHELAQSPIVTRRADVCRGWSPELSFKVSNREALIDDLQERIHMGRQRLLEREQHRGCA